MIIRNINEFKCYNCGKDEESLDYLYDMFDGLCEDCYSSSMNAAYEDLPDIFDESEND